MKIAMFATLGDGKANLGFSGPLESCLENISQAGFDGIELNFLEPAKVDARGLQENVRRHNLEISAFATGLTQSNLGWSFTNRDKTTREKAVNRIEEFIQLAAKLSVKVVVIGRVRGKIESTGNRAEQEGWLLECMQKCAKRAEEHDVCLAIESMSKTTTNVLNTVSETIAFLKKLGSSHVGILADTWHMSGEENSITAALVTAKPHLFHVHFADNQRRAPGTGSLHFGEIVNTLKSLCYDKYTTVECLPSPSPEFMLRKSSSYLRSLLM
jgi:sugar phosphate isomerase/epimerase